MNIKNSFLQYVSKNKLNTTVQRLNIIDMLSSYNSSHYSLDEVYQYLHTKDSSISQSTTYRTLKLLCDANILKVTQFQDGITRYELAEVDEHHDHLICTSCGKTIEIFSTKLEQIQETIAKEHNFKLLDHSHFLYGICENCIKK